MSRPAMKGKWKKGRRWTEAQQQRVKHVEWFHFYLTDLSRTYFFTVLLPKVSMVSMIMSITTIVPVRPIPALQRSQKKQS